MERPWLKVCLALGADVFIGSDEVSFSNGGVMGFVCCGVPGVRVGVLEW